VIIAQRVVARQLNVLKSKKRNKLNYLQLYNNLCKITISLICLVICAGGFVRMTGSGMGCPDWPKCFGFWIPPTDVSDLPLNYKEIYAERGYDKLDFNVFNTWTEYINRLLGLISGFFCIALLCTSFFTNNKYLICFNFFLVAIMGFQGWMGAVVVYSVLAPFKITIHMLIALSIVSVLLYLNRITNSQDYPKNTSHNTWIYIALIISIIQIVIGTQVRESVDILLPHINRISLVSELPSIFEYHRIVAWLVCLSNLILLIIAVVLLLCTGIGMTYYSLIGPLQFLHLILAVTLFIAQMSILMKKLPLPIVQIP
jgi:cytochrome c oxidase assembly protein subunit 15